MALPSLIAGTSVRRGDSMALADERYVRAAALRLAAMDERTPESVRLRALSAMDALLPEDRVHGGPVRRQRLVRIFQRRLHVQARESPKAAEISEFIGQLNELFADDVLLF